MSNQHLNNPVKKIKAGTSIFTGGYAGLVCGVKPLRRLCFS
jgi:hypothetical protein